MEMQKILIKIDTAIKMFIENEFEILQRSLNELYINNRFADYLKPLFYPHFFRPQLVVS